MSYNPVADFVRSYTDRRMQAKAKEGVARDRRVMNDMILSRGNLKNDTVNTVYTHKTRVASIMMSQLKFNWTYVQCCS